MLILPIKRKWFDMILSALQCRNCRKTECNWWHSGTDTGKMYRQYGQSAHYRPDMAGKNGEQNQERNIIF